MNSRKMTGLAISAVLMQLLSEACAQSSMTVTMAQPDELSISKSATGAVGVSQVKGESIQVLFGNPSQQGLYTVLLRISPHTRIAPLSHPDERFATVLSGTWQIGFGDSYDRSKLKILTAGGIYTEPRNANHYGETGDEPVLIAITGYGPSGTTYVNPADAPR